MSIFRDRPDLLARFRAGQRDALAEVYDAYADKVGRLVRRGFELRGEGSVRVGPQDFLDIVQEAFAKAFSPAARHNYDGLRAYEPYLLMIARNTSIDWLRRRGTSISFPPETLDRLQADQPAPGDRAPWENQHTLATLETYLAGLSPDLSTVHRCRYVEGLTQDATARALGISRQNLRTLEDRLRTGLKSALAQGDELAPTRNAATS